MRLKIKHWIYALGQTVIGGVAASGAAWMSSLVGAEISQAVDPINFSQLGWVLLGSTLMNLFFFLKTSPLPAEATGNTETITKDASKFGLVLLCGALALGATGCRNLAPDGVYKGDKVLLEAEAAIVTSYELVDTFLKWEKDNRALLAQWPEIKKGADSLRRQFPAWHRTANNLRDVYVANPSGTNAQNLSKALALLRTALAEAAMYMNYATQPK